MAKRRGRCRSTADASKTPCALRKASSRGLNVRFCTQVLSAAYPWVARRLLTDKSPELRATLRTLLYKDGRFQFSRLESLMQQALKMPPLPPRNSPKTTPMTVSNSPTTSMAATTTAASAAAAAAPAKATAAQLVSSRGSSVGAVSGGGGGSSGGAALQLLLGEEGDFVREIVVEELAKVGVRKKRLEFPEN